MGVIELMGVLIAFVLSRAIPSIPGWLAPVICFSEAVTVAMLIVLIEKTSKRRVQGYLSHLDEGKAIYYLKYHLTSLKGQTLPKFKMNALEARVNSVIRVTDLCFVQGPDTLLVTLKNPAERFKGICARLDRVFEEEKVHFSVSVEQGEFVKIARPQNATSNLHSVVN